MTPPHDPWQKSAAHHAHWTIRLIVIAAVGLLSLTTASAAENDDDAAPPLPKNLSDIARSYAGIMEWQGFFDSSTSGTTTKTNGNFSRSSEFEARTHGHFTLQRSSDGWDPRAGNFRWGGNNREQSGEATGSESEQFSERDGAYGTRVIWRSELGGTVPLFGVSFEINLLKNSGGVHMGFVPGDKYLKRTRTGNEVTYLSSSNGQRQYGSNIINEISTGSLDQPHIRTGHPSDREDAVREWETIRSGPGVLNFTYERTETSPNAPNRTHRSRITLVPVYDDLELEVTIAGYATWRPKGSIQKPSEPGNSLIVRGTLKSKTGKVKELPEVKRFRFELLDTSREPGVCLNWPLHAKDEDYDLRLAVAGAGRVSEHDQKLESTDMLRNENEQPYAEAKIDSFDFGGRATLQVICELEDGREIMGLIKTESGEKDLVRLPKMLGPDWIAESWRKEKKVEKLPAQEDDEKVEGQKDNGDGYTLYEEYRGWAEKGRHVEGDPLMKDFFVLNLVGADARPGIELFEAISELRVHSKLRRSEMSQKERVMNGNRRDGPRRVEQHGVWIKTFTREGLGDTGAQTPMTKSGVAGRPSITIGIGLLARGNLESVFNKPYNLPAQDAIFAYDRAIAHELLHSIGVEHHGTGDGRLSVAWVSPRHPRNKYGGPYFRRMMLAQAPKVTLLDENGHDLATQYMKNYSDDRIRVDNVYKEGLVAQGQAYMTDHAGQQGLAFNSAEAYTEYFLEEHVSGGYMFLDAYVGEMQGEHSGDQDCLMRYYFAEFYPAAGKEDVYYKVTPGTERIGMTICRSVKGTGVNLPKPPHLPQSRYGDAAKDAGNCFQYICPNDAIPARKL